MKRVLSECSYVPLFQTPLHLSQSDTFLFLSMGKKHDLLWQNTFSFLVCSFPQSWRFLFRKAIMLIMVIVIIVVIIFVFVVIVVLFPSSFLVDGFKISQVHSSPWAKNWNQTFMSAARRYLQPDSSPPFMEIYFFEKLAINSWKWLRKCISNI